MVGSVEHALRSSRHSRGDLRRRLLPAILGGYLLASEWSLAIPLLWSATAPGEPLRAADGVLIGAMSGLAVCVLAVLWSFAAPSVRQAWAGLFAPAAILALLSVLVAS